VFLFLAGALPVGVAVGAYNRVAFGSPFHFSYGYVDIPSQKEGFFGISAPTWRGSTQFCSEYTALSGSSRFLLSRQSALYFCGVAGFALKQRRVARRLLMQEDDFASTGREGALEVVGRAVVARDYFERRHRLPP
jgi:hypothetical protein